MHQFVFCHLIVWYDLNIVLECQISDSAIRGIIFLLSYSRFIQLKKIKYSNSSRSCPSPYQLVVCPITTIIFTSMALAACWTSLLNRIEWNRPSGQNSSPSYLGWPRGEGSQGQGLEEGRAGPEGVLGVSVVHQVDEVKDILYEAGLPGILSLCGNLKGNIKLSREVLSNSHSII